MLTIASDPVSRPKPLPHSSRRWDFVTEPCPLPHERGTLHKQLAALVGSFCSVLELVSQRMLGDLPRHTRDFGCPVAKGGSKTMRRSNAVLFGVEIADAALGHIRFVHSNDELAQSQNDNLTARSMTI